MTPRKVAIEAV